MTFTRRHFLKLSASAAAVTAFGGLGFSLKPTAAQAQLLKLRWAKETTSICCYCAVGCGLIVHTSQEGQGRAINVEGDPDHPVSEGSLCAKGAAIFNLGENEDRITSVLYRAPGSEKWQETSWDWALDTIAKRVKETRDATFTRTNAQGQEVNRCNGLASVGSAAIDNEECWVYQAMLRSLGLVYIEHQARICHSATVAALAESFGRGAMTNHWIDIKNSDCILIMGSNAAENHPVSFKWVTKAQEKGAQLIHVDPRYTRTSAKADIYAPLRSGSDIAFLGGLIKYLTDKEMVNWEYVINYTNATFILSDEYGFEDGLFAGFDPKTKSYDKSKWSFVLDENGVPKRDTNLADPRCVYNLMRKHYERYTLDKVSKATGTPKEDLLKVYKAYAASYKADKSATIMYAMGWTQHTVGVQNIRAMAMIQLLLGNIGVAGGGVNALRGESNVQGSTDHCLLYHILPGYLKTPKASQPTLQAYNEAYTPVSNDPKSANWWQHYPKYSASLIKAMYKDAPIEKGYKWLPKLDDGKGYSFLELFDAMYREEIKGFFAWGQNPASGLANSNKSREALSKLDWMVVTNIFDNETASFWKGPNMDPKSVDTEVFFLPCAVSIEKEGSITNSGRWMQWRYEGPKPLPNTKTDGDMIVELTKRLQKLYANEGGTYSEPIVNLSTELWEKNGKYDPHKVAKLINGFFLKDVTVRGKSFKAGDQVPSFAYLLEDGTTTSGNWLYCNSYTNEGNMAARRDKSQTKMQANIGLYPNWSWCWPVNRRIIYNRASVDLKGKPYAPDKPVIKWTGDSWAGDVPDGGWPPGEKHAFIMRKHGFGQIFGPGRADGPFPEYYEPLECPLEEHPFSSQLHNPTALTFEGAMDKRRSCDPRYPFVGTTYRVTEHWQSGVMTRWQPWLIEAEPELFVEMSPELAKMRGIENGERVIVESARGQVKAVAMVTPRMQPFTIMGQVIHQIGLPWHYGWVYPKDSGDAANLLTPSVGDANTGIPETKAFMVNVRKI